MTKKKKLMSYYGNDIDGKQYYEQLSVLCISLLIRVNHLIRLIDYEKIIFQLCCIPPHQQLFVYRLVRENFH